MRAIKFLVLNNITKFAQIFQPNPNPSLALMLGWNFFLNFTTDHYGAITQTFPTKYLVFQCVQDQS